MTDLLPVGVLRLAVVAVVLGLLARAGWIAWHQRRVAVAVWRRIRPRHVLGSLGLVTVVLTTAVTLLLAVPATGIGLGSLIGLSGNAVFAPLEEATVRSEGQAAVDAMDPDAGGETTGELATRGPSPWLVLLTVAFLGGLFLLFPWLAYVEERAFREGLEDAALGRQVWTALKFGLLHMVMLIPLAAALAISVAGFTYGRIYRRAYRRAAARTELVEGPFGIPVVLRPPPARLRAQAVLETTVWHATFNSTIVALILVGFVAEWVLLA